MDNDPENDQSSQLAKDATKRISKKWLKRGLAAVFGSSTVLAIVFAVVFAGLLIVMMTTSSDDNDCSTDQDNTSVTAGAATSADMNKNAKTVYDYLIKKGATSAGVAAVIGNMQSESGLNPARTQGDVAEGAAVSDTDVGLGLVQWTADRHTALLNAAKAKGVDWKDMSFQLDYLWQEVQKTPSFKKILSSNDIDSATQAWIDDYERPQVRTQPSRQAQAHQWYTKLAGTDPVMTSSFDNATDPTTSTSSDGGQSDQSCEAGGDDSSDPGEAKGDDYPDNLKNATQDSIDDQNGYPNRECTSWSAWRMQSAGVPVNLIHALGNGAQWATSARAEGVQVDHDAKAGTIAQFDGTGSNPYGHVAYVDSVDGDKVKLEEYNWLVGGAPDGKYHTRTIPVSQVSNFIHFKGTKQGDK